MEEETKVKEKPKSKVAKLLEKADWTFVVRLIVFITLALAPAVYLFIKYRCFEVVKKVSFSGWGILGILIVVGVIYIVLRYVVFGGKYAYWKQIIKTIISITLPISLALTLIVISRDFINELIVFVSVALGCWTTAGIINPLPQWSYKKSLGETADALDYAFSRFKNKAEK